MAQKPIETFANVVDLLEKTNPQHPVYCIYPHVYRETVQHFVNGFPGRVLYAVKANIHPELLRIFSEAGIREFDCASLREIELVRETCPDSTIYFMNPVRFRGDARIAQEKFGLRHFLIDHASGLAPLLDEIDPANSVIFARMAVSHASALTNLSAKFGAKPENIPSLLKAIAASGAEAALAFNVGSGVRDPEAYAYAIGIVRQILDQIPFKIRLLDIGGGFPKSYPGYIVPPLEDFFARTRTAAIELPLADSGEMLAEPGRALSAPGMSAVTCVLLRKTDRVYLNDGMFGIFWDLRVKGQLEYPCRVFRNGRLLQGATKSFRVLGPTCDSDDELPARIELPADVDVGDHIEFGTIGAYSLSGRSDFNGFYSDNVVSFTDSKAQPPA